jgi:IclR family transcriptional regulator, acetate operon repressor
MSRATESLKSLRRAAQILGQFSARTPDCDPGEIIRAMEIPRSTGYRFLQAMIELGLLDRDAATGRLRPGLSFVALGQLAQQQFELGQVARPFMEELALETQETVLLAVLREGHAYCAEKVESVQRVRLSFDLFSPNSLRPRLSA